MAETPKNQEGEYKYQGPEKPNGFNVEREDWKEKKEAADKARTGEANKDQQVQEAKNQINQSWVSRRIEDVQGAGEKTADMAGTGVAAAAATGGTLFKIGFNPLKWIVNLGLWIGKKMEPMLSKLDPTGTGSIKDAEDVYKKVLEKIVGKEKEEPKK